MRLISRSNRWALLGLGMVIGLAAGIAGGPLVRLGIAHYYQEDYSVLVFQCDQAMREHFIAKSRVAKGPDDQSVNLLAASEVALMDCHTYDVMRKDLQRMGLTEADLAAMGLEAIEERGQDIREVVRIHEIRY